MKLPSFKMVIAAVGAACVLAQVSPVSTQVRSRTPRNVPGITKPVVVVSGRIAANETWSSGSFWVLRGAVFVPEGVTLTIQPGTTVIGESGSVGTLIVERGGKLNAIGTRELPIVFTSDQPVGQRARGDWGGIILNGRAPVNLEGGEGEGEADTGIYGGDNPADSSGSMVYVRVEFAGTEFSPDNELNGIAFQAVGNGGRYEYLQVHMNKDDAFEWFGGTADIKHAIASNAGDDSFDWTFGWRGRGQFLAVTQRGDDADAGIEADNNEFNNELLPRAAPTLYNLTLCGDRDTNEGTESVRGMLLRRGTAGEIRNFVITNFKNVGLEVNGAASIREATAGNLRVSNGVIFNTGAGGTTYSPATTTALFNTVFPNVRVGQDPGIGNCANHDAPNFLPTGIATLAGGQLAPATPPNDGFFQVTTFIGAFHPDPERNWMTGWTSFPQR
jgi:hypothetical protein